MKQALLLGFLSLQITLAYSQLTKNDIIFEARYPVPVGNNFINQGLGNGYLGIVDVGVGYTILRKKSLKAGILFNSSVLRLSETNATLTTFSPKLMVAYGINLNRISIIPQAGIGYSRWAFRVPASITTDFFGNTVQNPRSVTNENGLTLRWGIKIASEISDRLKLYFIWSYEYTKLGKPDSPVVNDTFNRDLQLIYPGLGLICNFGK